VSTGSEVAPTSPSRRGPTSGGPPVLTGAFALAWWATVVVIGWTGYYLAGGGGDAGSAAAERAANWAVGMPPALGIGLLLWWVVERRLPPSRAAGTAVLAVGAWGAANAVGWTVDVTVGGPATGLVTGCAVAGAAIGRGVASVGFLRLRLLGVIAVGTAAMVAGRVLSGFDAFFPRVVLPILFGTVAAGAAWWLLRIPASFRSTAVLMFGWTLSWLVGFEIALRLPADLPAGVYVVVELGLACWFGGLVTGFVTRGLTAEKASVVGARWAVSSVIGTVLGMLLAQAYWAWGPAPSRVVEASDLWAAGTTFGLGLAAGVALLPTLVRAAGRRGTEEGGSAAGSPP
jgi:hypothetical protein